MRPSGYLDSMRIVLRVGGRAVGAMIVHRDRTEGRFVMHEKRQLAAIAPFVAHAAGSTQEHSCEIPLVADDNSGLVIVDRAGRLQYVSSEARRLLFLATHPQVDANTRAAADTQFILPAEVRQICKNLVDVFEGNQPSTSPPIWRHQNPWGGFSFRAYWLNGGSPEPSPLIGITIQHETPLAVKLIAKLEQFPLSRRQMDICLLLAANYVHAEIAKRMGMSEHTVTTHIRRIYEKLAVHNKTELMNKLLDK
jgi:DNA-binding CsgD family transcriptional regulator